MAKTRTSGQGRPRGASNLATRELKDILWADAPAIRKELVRLCLHAENETTRVTAIKEFHDRWIGKAAQSVVHSGTITTLSSLVEASMAAGETASPPKPSNSVH